MKFCSSLIWSLTTLSHSFRLTSPPGNCTTVLDQASSLAAAAADDDDSSSDDDEEEGEEEEDDADGSGVGDSGDDVDDSFLASADDDDDGEEEEEEAAAAHDEDDGGEETIWCEVARSDCFSSSNPKLSPRWNSRTVTLFICEEDKGTTVRTVVVSLFQMKASLPEGREIKAE